MHTTQPYINCVHLIISTHTVQINVVSYLQYRTTVAFRALSRAEINKHIIYKKDSYMSKLQLITWPPQNGERGLFT